ncbi:MAG: type III pantothenate kinase [Erysipelothrix sp.]
MILTIDIGNSNTVLVGYENDDRVFTQRIETHKENVYTYYKEVFSAIDINVSEVVVSCVVPSVYEEFNKCVKEIYKIEPKYINGDTIINFKILLDEPRDIGADFIATGVGALAKYTQPVIIADVGSATKLTVIDSEGSFAGGVIVPGLGTSVEALNSFIPHLPSVELIVPNLVIGNGTIPAIQSGVMFGLIAQIEGLANKMEAELGQKCIRVLTGGYAALFKDDITGFVYDPYLLSDGMYQIVKKGMLV